MTAVAAPPSAQSLDRLGWYSSNNGEQDALSSPNADDFSRMLMSRKSVKRTNSSSSLSSSTSSASASTVSAPPQSSNAGQTAANELGSGSSKKKPSRYIWSSSKAEPVAGVTNARPQTVSAPPSGTTASSAMSALHQPSSVVPSQHMHQSAQQNGVRGGGNRQGGGDPTAILSLAPLNGTFDRKQVTVPYFPEVLRIGRQTNNKTVPTAVNGYFDSKVLSRQHAEVWADRAGKIWIRDVKSSNGTFINGQRLSPESRDSEPHEVREHDTLELGIDIISEDQKSIVHHKVSAKVEHAGIYGPNMNIMDLNFGDIDPTAGGGLLPHANQPVPHMRGRQGSAGSVASNRSSMTSNAGQLNALQQRQINYWHSPISIEQVVKKLSTEMKHAKEQSYDLNLTNDFMSSLAWPERQEKEKAKPSPPTGAGSGRQVNGQPKVPKIDTFARFSEPPAPPPTQPLPEKPDAAPRISPSDPALNAALKRSDTERPKPTVSSPGSRESSQILSLIEALSQAKKELDSQGSRVKELETLLTQERVARESAEERARKLEDKPTSTGDKVSEIDAAFEPPSEDHTLTDSSENVAVAPSNDSSSAEADAESSSKDASMHGLQQRFDSMLVEMDSMRKEVERYKDSAQRAQTDALESRKTLAEMIESIRRERSKATPTGSEREEEALLDIAAEKTKSLGNNDQTTEIRAGAFGNQPVQGSDLAHLDKSDSTITPLTKQRYRSQVLEQSTPYASMLGVVLLGVGIMAYLNQWQKVDK